MPKARLRVVVPARAGLCRRALAQCAGALFRQPPVAGAGRDRRDAQHDLASGRGCADRAAGEENVEERETYQPESAGEQSPTQRCFLSQGLKEHCEPKCGQNKNGRMRKPNGGADEAEDNVVTAFEAAFVH